MNRVDEEAMWNMYDTQLMFVILLCKVISNVQLTYDYFVQLCAMPTLKLLGVERV